MRNHRRVLQVSGLMLGLLWSAACSKSGGEGGHAGHEGHGEQASQAAPAGGENHAAHVEHAEAAPAEYLKAGATLQEMVKAGGHIMPKKDAVAAMPTPQSQPNATFDAAFGKVLTEYFAIRKALAGDGVTGVKEAAGRLKEALAEVKAAPSPAVADAEKGNLSQQLDALGAATDGLMAEGVPVEGARETFALVSKPVMYVVAFHYGGNAPEIFYCPMKNLAWLQDEAQMGNPYYGSQMLTCGLKVAQK